jgi:SH3-like domain-containing protein
MFKKIIIFLTLCLAFNSALADDYFLTLKNDKVNLRQGPSFEYPIKIFYKKKNLPVLIKDKSANFRKIIDHENNSGWIHISQLSKKRAAIIISKSAIVFRKPTLFSKPQVILKKGKLCIINKCNKEWCKIKVNKYIGWIQKEKLWGRI